MQPVGSAAKARYICDICGICVTRELRVECNSLLCLVDYRIRVTDELRHVGKCEVRLWGVLMYVDVNGYALRLLALSHGHMLRLLVTRPAVFHPLDICCFLLFALTPTLYLIIVVVVTIDITEKDEVAVSYGPLQGFKKLLRWLYSSLVQAFSIRFNKANWSCLEQVY